MADPVSLTIGGIGAASNALNLVKAFVDIRDSTKVLELKSELMGLLVDAQLAQSALIDDKRVLAERVRELEAWDREKQRYEMQQVGPNNAIAFGLKPDAKGVEPDHRLCANCFGRGHKSFLQRHAIPSGRAEVLMCHACKSQILMKGAADTRA